MDNTAKQMNDYWHIPRASLTPSSAASSSAASSASSSKSKRSQRSSTKQQMKGQQISTISSSVSGMTNAAATAAAAAAVLAAAKRGSRSSQGSSDSNNSTRSAVSGSLLLTAANLERFAEIHKKQEHQHKILMNDLPETHTTSNMSATTNYNSNLMLQQQQNNINTVIPINGDDDNDIDPNLHYIKTKDLDSVSIASSMHFTMVNGDNGAAKKPKRGLCDRGRQVTVLIISMSTIFMLLIMGMVYALEMRARDMPKS